MFSNQPNWLQMYLFFIDWKSRSDKVLKYAIQIFLTVVEINEKSSAQLSPLDLATVGIDILLTKATELICDCNETHLVLMDIWQRG